MFKQTLGARQQDLIPEAGRTIWGQPTTPLQYGQGTCCCVMGLDQVIRVRVRLQRNVKGHC